MARWLSACDRSLGENWVWARAAGGMDSRSVLVCGGATPTMNCFRLLPEYRRSCTRHSVHGKRSIHNFALNHAQPAGAFWPARPPVFRGGVESHLSRNLKNGQLRQR